MKLTGLYSTYEVATQKAFSGGQAVLFEVPGSSLLYKRFNSPPKTAAISQDLHRRLRESAP